MKLVKEMKIDFKRVPIRPIKCVGEVTYDESYYNNTGIVYIPPIKFNLEITPNEDIILNTQSYFTLIDSKTLEEVNYSFTINFNENLNNSEFFDENLQNTLDIKEILWQNIVLEVPISYTTSNDDLTY